MFRFDVLGPKLGVHFCIMTKRKRRDNELFVEQSFGIKLKSDSSVISSSQSTKYGSGNSEAFHPQSMR